MTPVEHEIDAICDWWCADARVCAALHVPLLVYARDSAVSRSGVSNVRDGVSQLHIDAVCEPMNDGAIAGFDHCVLASEEAVVVVLVPARRAHQQAKDKVRDGGSGGEAEMQKGCRRAVRGLWAVGEDQCVIDTW